MKKILLTIGILALLIVVPNFTFAESTSVGINEQIKAVVNDGTYASAKIKSNGDTKLDTAGDMIFLYNPFKVFLFPLSKIFTFLRNVDTSDNITLDILSGSLTVTPIRENPITLKSGKIEFTKFVGFVQFKDRKGDGVVTYISGTAYGVTIEGQ